MKNTIARTRKFVQDHKTPIAFVVGTTAGAALTYYLTYGNKTVMEVPTQEVLTHMRETGDAVLYVTKTHGDLMLKALPQN